MMCSHLWLSESSFTLAHLYIQTAQLHNYVLFFAYSGVLRVLLVYVGFAGIGHDIRVHYGD